MFKKTSAFAGNGVASFNVVKVVLRANFAKVFDDAASLTSCNKKRIDDAWKSNGVFNASDFGWTAGSDR